ncbi:hypothetical protein FRX31_014786 [Thalictrum thalictroides]|uniref:Uncharacterized protein n=1 Tax=Thalictrum thalictroides TaxID=46969 RepID=A0A7J6WFF8_THATH|nr:hypothetical protein FRX31_014786 [Thalictrum thalictroides]
MGLMGMIYDRRMEEQCCQHQKKSGGKSNAVNIKKPRSYGEITVQHTEIKEAKEGDGTSSSKKGGKGSTKSKGGGNTFGKMPWWLGEPGSSMHDEYVRFCVFSILVNVFSENWNLDYDIMLQFMNLNVCCSLLNVIDVGST